MNATQPTNPQITAVLAQIEKFGFKFFGYGENNDPLVVAPNGQIIPLKVAYEFVQQQIKNAAQTSGGGPESMPVMPQMPDSKPMEVNLEKSPEKESGIEKAQEKTQNTQQPIATTGNNTQVSTDQVQDTSIKMPLPFVDGFKVKTFDPTNIKEAEDFVKSNSNASNSTSKKWLSVQFEKFLKEYEIKGGKAA